MKRNRLIAILMAVTITLTYMPAMAYGGSEEDPQNEGAILEESPDAGVTDTETADPAETEEPSDSPAVQPEEEDPAYIQEDTLDETGSPEKEPSNEDALSEEKASVIMKAQSDSEWGPWSAWQDEAVSGSATRQVETRQVVDSYRMSSYVFQDSASPSQRGYAPYNAYGPLRAHHEETWAKSLVDSARWRLGAGSYYDSPDNDNCDGLIHDGTAYVVVHGQGHDYVPFFITGTNYKTQYRFRDIKTTTPKCSKTIPRITSATITWTQPSGDITGYEIQYSTSPQFKNSKKVIVKGGSNCRYKLTGLKPGTVYYIRIRVYVVVNGKTVYKKWGNTCRMKTYSKKGNLSSAKWSGVKNCAYTGKPVKRTLKLVRNGTVLKEGTDYKVTYKNNTKVGIATIIVKGCGKYFGTVTKNFTIRPKGASVSKCTSKTKAIIVKWNKRRSNCSGYQVRYCTRSDFKNCKYKTVKGKNTGSCTLSGLRPNTKYYIEVRVYCIVNNKNYYSAWSKAGAVRTKKVFCTEDETVYDVIKMGNYAYCGSGGDIYKVNLKTKKARRFVGTKALEVRDLSVHNGYLYYIYYGHDYSHPGTPPLKLYRVSLATGKTAFVVNAITYYIKGNNIYYASYAKNSSGGWYVGPWIRMSMNGKNRSNLKVKGRWYAGYEMYCNVDGYRTVDVQKSVKATTYLVLPSREKIRLSYHYVQTGIEDVWLDEQWYQ